MRNPLPLIALAAVFIFAALPACTTAEAAPTATDELHTNALRLKSTKNVGTLTLGNIDAGVSLGRATVNSGSVCTCTDTTAVAACRAAVSTTTLTVYGTDAHVVAYACF